MSVVKKKVAPKSSGSSAQDETVFSGPILSDSERSSPVLIIGESGKGKSRSILNLDPEETFLFNVLGKDLPFRGWRKKYTKENMFIGTSYSEIERKMDVLKTKDTIKYLVIDDFQYLMADEFMRRGMERGFDKFIEIGQHAYSLIKKSGMLGRGRIVFFLAHSDVNDQGVEKVKTIGKMLDEKICVEGLFTIVLNCGIDKGEYFFTTKNNGRNTVKSPEGMFATERVPNDLSFVAQAIDKYENG